ncbi:aldose 1-epimerase family protein [Salinibacterium sp. ZJ77]|uniref:aldose 1-epimerase family protein n=1 Tax=Salinibacterium sp. ZJ77 TaxID=2708337 RepID=UPI001423B085|nr:aldose 1-epimerase family protein [Salinibacterium sp. ZJ77]
MLTPIGDIIELRTPRSTASVATLAAALTSLTVDGRDLAERTPATRLPSHGHGIVLAPWPNRVRDARWSHEGQPLQLDITDPTRGNAIHGLLRNTAYRVLARDEASVELGAVIHPQHGWPFQLETIVRYALAEDGLTVTHRARNIGRARAPWAVGAHPYFRIGETPVDDLTLEVPAARYLELDERLVPVGVADVEPGSEVDLGSPRRLGDADLNVAYEGLPVGGDVATLAAPDGSRLVLWQDGDFGWLQVFTPRDFPHVASDGSETRGLAVALEPMSAAPDALNSGRGLAWLEPDEIWEASWGARFEES